MGDKGIESLVKTEGEVVKTYFYKDQSHKTQVAGALNRISEEEMNDMLKEFGDKIREIDVRQLEMPQPMITILEEVEKLKDGELLYMHHRKVPQYLLPELEQRELQVYLSELGTYNVKLLIH